MATRCTVKLVGLGENEIQYFYHHYDGYPKGVGQDIMEYLKDKEVWDFKKIICDINAGFIGADPTYDMSKSIHGDENYIYLINCLTKEFKCYKNSKLTNNENYIFVDDNLVNI